MLNKKDPLIDAIQQIMQSNQADRDAVKVVNEKFGIQDRRVLPRERQDEWDAAYKSVLSEGLHPNQQKLDVHEPEKDKLTKHDFKMLRAKKKPMEEDVTSPSSMGIKKPDYATGTPDYAKSKEQMPNRAAKTSLPAGTMKEEEQIDEKAPPGAKYERMVKHIKSKMAKGGLTKKEKSIAYATAWKAKKLDEAGGAAGGFVQAMQKKAAAAASPVKTQRQASGDVAPQRQNLNKRDLGVTAVQNMNKGREIAKTTSGAAPKSPMSGQGTASPAPKSPMSGQGTSGARPAKVTPTGNPNMAGSGGNVGKAPVPTPKPAGGATGKVKPVAQKLKPVRKQPNSGTVKPTSAGVAAKPVKKLTPLQQQMKRSKTGRDAGVAGE